MQGLLRRQGRTLLLICAFFAFASPIKAQNTAPEESEGESGARSGVVINLPPNPTLPSVDQLLVVDVQRILEQSLAVQSIQNQLTAARQSFQAEMRAREAALQERDRELASQRAAMDAGAFQAERDRLASDLASLQDDIRVWFRAHDQAQNLALRQAQQTLLRIVSEIAQTRGAVIVIPKSSIVLVQPNLDITEEALQRLNRDLPSLPEPVLPGGSAAIGGGEGEED